MKIHLYEFNSEKKKVKCLCGWERGVRKIDIPTVYKMFEEHCAQEAHPAKK
jgi:hypothetical protein